MEISPALRRSRAVMALVTLASFLPACTVMTPLKTPYEENLDKQHPDFVWVTRTNGSVVSVYGPVVTADSLFGRATADSSGAPIAMALWDVSKIDTKQPSVSATIFFVALIAGGVGMIVWLFTWNPLAGSSFSLDRLSR